MQFRFAHTTIRVARPSRHALASPVSDDPVVAAPRAADVRATPDTDTVQVLEAIIAGRDDVDVHQVDAAFTALRERRIALTPAQLGSLFDALMAHGGRHLADAAALLRSPAGLQMEKRVERAALLFDVYTSQVEHDPLAAERAAALLHDGTLQARTVQKALALFDSCIGALFAGGMRPERAHFAIALLQSGALGEHAEHSALRMFKLCLADKPVDPRGCELALQLLESGPLGDACACCAAELATHLVDRLLDAQAHPCAQPALRSNFASMSAQGWLRGPLGTLATEIGHGAEATAANMLRILLDAVERNRGQEENIPACLMAEQLIRAGKRIAIDAALACAHFDACRRIAERGNSLDWINNAARLLLRLDPGAKVEAGKCLMHLYQRRGRHDQALEHLIEKDVFATSTQHHAVELLMHCVKEKDWPVARDVLVSDALPSLPRPVAATLLAMVLDQAGLVRDFANNRSLEWLDYEERVDTAIALVDKAFADASRKPDVLMLLEALKAQEPWAIHQALLVG